MSKSINRPYSEYSLDAMRLLGQLIREGRLAKALTTTELAERAGISRALLRRIERGNPACAIGAVFETAALCGVTLFEPDGRSLSTHLARQTDKLALLPKSVRLVKTEVRDDF